MHDKLFLLITLISAFVLMFAVCGSSDNKMGTNSNESVEDVTNSDAGENGANDSEGDDVSELAENGYHSDRDELEENNFIAIEENAKIVYGEVPVYLDGEIGNEMEMLTFYLNCGNQ